MFQFPSKLQDKIEIRKQNNAFRTLGVPNDLIDFSSNDYLGFATSEIIFKRASEILKEHNLERNGATGSRLLTGNHQLFETTETLIAACHGFPEALIFNSGYDANMGFFSSVPQRGDTIFYDEYCHASIRDGIAMSHAKAYKFAHNNFSDLEKKMSVRAESRAINEEFYVVTESVFSMDGDQPDLRALVVLCEKFDCRLIVDEAHAVGVMGTGRGLLHELSLQARVFAQIVTFGKALGCHSAAILGSDELKQYLVNFARSFIYTTGQSPHTIATIQAAYEQLVSAATGDDMIENLHRNIAILQSNVIECQLQSHFIPSESAIHCCIVSGNSNARNISAVLQAKGFDVKPILSPTVPLGSERLRICLHSFNTKEQIEQLLQILATLL